MAAILQSLTFGTDNKATLGPCPLGSVWTVLVSVPRATNSSSFEVYLQGTQLGSMQGTATFGPFQMRGNEVLTIVSTGAQVTAAQTVTVMGQADAEKDAPTGIFPVVSGGVVTTSGAAVTPFLCIPTSYPAVGGATVNYSITSTTMVAVDSTNLVTESFDAPASGTVVVRCYLAWSGPSSTNSLFLGLLSGSTQVGASIGLGRTGSQVTSSVTWVVPGLQSGLGYTFALAAAVTGGTFEIYGTGEQGTTPAAPGGPIVLTVEAA